MTIQQAFDLALQHHQSGRLVEAEALYRHILAVQPNHAEALHHVGVIAHQVGRNDVAVELIHQAIVLAPGVSRFHSNLGEAHRALGQLDEAIAAFRQAIFLEPNLPEAYYNLGIAFKGKGQLAEAIAAYRDAIALRPGYADAYCNLAFTLSESGQLDEAIAVGRRCIALEPTHLDAQNNLGSDLMKKGMLDEAVSSFRRAIALKSDFAEAHSNLGSALMKQGLLDEAIASYRETIAVKPDFAQAHSNLLLSLHYHPGWTAPALAEEHRLWNIQHADPLLKGIRPHTNDRDSERRLRIGYVSPDFMEHVAGLYLLPLVEHRDRERFEVYCYSSVERPDAITGRFRALVERWRDIARVNDAQLAEMIREDGIDILVDLSQHMGGNRLPAFARKPAPVQVSFLGYPGGTAMQAIDYRISDRYLEGGSAVEAYGSRERVFLIDSFWCYDPLGVDVAVNALPAMEGNVVTFGCLNNFCKINHRVLALWSQVLGQVEGSRLMILSFAGSHRERTLAMLRQCGVDASRVEFVLPRPQREYLELYHRIDIGLDTFPYNGHTTSLDAFWMGVPVIGLVGELPVSRAGLSNLMNLGLPELVANEEDDYVELAVKLAGDLPRLAELRATLRERMKSSVLMDAPRYARRIEEAYRSMWHQWCGGSEGEFAALGGMAQ